MRALYLLSATHGGQLASCAEGGGPSIGRREFIAQRRFSECWGYAHHDPEAGNLSHSTTSPTANSCGNSSSSISAASRALGDLRSRTHQREGQPIVHMQLEPWMCINALIAPQHLDLQLQPHRGRRWGTHTCCCQPQGPNRVPAPSALAKHVVNLLAQRSNHPPGHPGTG